MRSGSILARPWVIAVLCVIAVALAAEFSATRSSAAPSAATVNAAPRADAPLLYTVAKRYEPMAWTTGAERFPVGAALVLRSASGRHALVRDFAASADPSLSFDAKAVLFAGKQKPQDHWQIWEIALANGTPRQLTACADDCIRPFYLPGDRIVYARKSDGRFVIEAAALSNGQAVAPIVGLTYGAGSSLPTDILRDGRILFEAISPFGPDGTPELYTVYSDGSGVESYRCDHGNAHYAGKQVSSDDIVFASSLGLSRFTSALAHEIRIAAPTGEYSGDVAETSSGNWLLSWRPSEGAPFQLMRWTVGAGSDRVERAPLSATRGSLRPVVVEQGANIVQPVVVAERTTPKRHPSALHDWPNANLLCLNAYTSKYKFAAASIRTVRMYTRGGRGEARLLGAAPVERDGSFFVQVPTERPLQIELLDASGKILRREAGWFWMRRGEQRVCVGCHAGPETAPENAVPLILLKSTTPADMTGSSTQPSSGGHY